jgi:hypothetical protein
MTIQPERLTSLVITSPQDGDLVDCSNFRVEGTVIPAPGTGANGSTVTATIVFFSRLGVSGPTNGAAVSPTAGSGNTWAFQFSTTSPPGTTIFITVTATTPDGDTFSVQIQVICQGPSPVPLAGVPAALAAGPTLQAEITSVTMPPPDAIEATDKRLIVDGTVTAGLPAPTTILLSGLDTFANVYHGIPHPTNPPLPAGKWSMMLFNVPTPLDLTLIMVAINDTQVVTRFLTLNAETD